MRLFGADVTPAAQAYDPALQYELDQISAATTGATATRLCGSTGARLCSSPRGPGLKLDRDAAARAIVQALASLQRPLTVDLP